VNQHSLGWVCVNAGEDLVGFVNVVSDGAVPAFLLDTMVRKDFRGVGIGTDMVEIAVPETRAAGCEWLHVDLEDHLEGFYFGRCGFKRANAGLIAFQ
jgi:GNAT superfamily N-acetyltransferase